MYICDFFPFSQFSHHLDVLLCNTLTHQQSAGPKAECAFWSIRHLPCFSQATGLPAKYAWTWRRGLNTFHSPTSSLMLMKCPTNGLLTCGGAERCGTAADLNSCYGTGHRSDPSNYHTRLTEEEESNRRDAQEAYGNQNTARTGNSHVWFSGMLCFRLIGSYVGHELLLRTWFFFLLHMVYFFGMHAIKVFINNAFIHLFINYVFFKRTWLIYLLSRDFFF